MRLKKVHLLILILAIFTFTVALTNSFKSRDFESLLKKVNNNNSNAANVNIDMTKYMYSYNSNSLGISKNDLNYVTYVNDHNKFLPCKNSKELNKSYAISDVEFLFKLLKYSYAGYAYFGGDITFENAKNNIIKTISNMQKDKITSAELENILITNFNFIQDSHFSINNNPMLKSLSYYSDDNLRFTKSRNNYYTFENGKKLYIKSIDDNPDFEDYMKLSIDMNGKLCYCIGKISNSSSSVKKWQPHEL